MATKFYQSNQRIVKVDGNTVQNKKYQIAYNPNNHNKLHLTLQKDNLFMHQQFDNLEEFFKQIENNNLPIQNIIRQDIEKIKSLPLIKYNQPFTKKFIKSKPKPKPKSKSKSNSKLPIYTRKKPYVKSTRKKFYKK
tara:strand:- start:4455 stop:4862 length:408 start_codon:yes stop_codon:yes gene_type:complete